MTFGSRAGFSLIPLTHDFSQVSRGTSLLTNALVSLRLEPAYLMGSAYQLFLMNPEEKKEIDYEHQIYLDNHKSSEVFNARTNKLTSVYII